MLVLANWNQDVFFLENVALLGPTLNAFVAIAHGVAIFASSWFLRIFRCFLQLCEKLRVEDVDSGLKRLWNHVVLQEAQVEKDQDVIQVDTRSEELEVLLADLYGPI